MVKPKRIIQTTSSLYKVHRARAISFPLSEQTAQQLDDPKKSIEWIDTLAQKYQCDSHDYKNLLVQAKRKLRLIEEAGPLSQHHTARANLLDTIGAFAAKQVDKHADPKAQKDFTKVWEGCCTMANRQEKLAQKDKNYHKSLTPNQHNTILQSTTPIKPRRITKEER